MNKIENINILLLGNTGVGKSTLINCILELKNNKAEEGHTVKPMNLESWKKYPYNSEDTDIKGIQLWDSRGIESNDIEQNNENVKKIIEENKNYLDKQIHCIWFCIHKNKFDEGEKNYINNLLEVYNTKEKIPIIFIFTKAYNIYNETIEEIEKELKEIKYFKEKKKIISFYRSCCKGKGSY